MSEVKLLPCPCGAPVGVEWTDEAAHAFRKEVDSVGAHWHPWPVRFRAGMKAALAQQPAAPSAPVGDVGGIMQRALCRIALGHEPAQTIADDAIAEARKVALAQQPAAVDGAMAERFCRRWYEITGRSLERAHVLASLDAALATQHQEPTT